MKLSGHVLEANTASMTCLKGYEEVLASQNQNPQEKGCAKNRNQSITTPNRTILSPF